MVNVAGYAKPSTTATSELLQTESCLTRKLFSSLKQALVQILGRSFEVGIKDPDATRERARLQAMLWLNVALLYEMRLVF